jgi:hypothetical protein
MIIKKTNMWVIDTQNKENYGAHDWDGKGECPQRWKFKGGSCIKITDVPLSVSHETLMHLAIDAFTEFNDYYEVDVLGIHIEHDQWMSDFEKSQLEYEGSITFAEPKFSFKEFYRKAGVAIAERKEMFI